YHTLLEGGFRDPATALATAERFAEAGYQVRICALAVPAALSQLGIIERYARQIEVTGTGRWTTAASHDADYTGTIQVLRLAQASPAVSRISLLTRDGLVYDNHRDPTGHWTSPVPAVDVLSEARDTSLTRLQRAALANRLTDTLDRLERASSAHPALHEMAAEIQQVLSLRTPDRPAMPRHPHEPTTAREPTAVRALGPDLNFSAPEPPGPELGQEL
ncbi:MAG TPA: zeta toxin family protein, partial [Actinomycetes bacterium]|nr:zeta toxin family protein [Actinomycetes bacterium]